MPAYGKRLKLRLFLEGVEIPCVAIQVDSTPNSPCTASIQVLPLSLGLKLLPRTLVHAFYYDFDDPGVHGGAVADTRKAEPKPDELAKEIQEAIDVDAVNGRYKLIFCGEVVGVQWTKNVGNRSLVLQCMDL